MAKVQNDAASSTYKNFLTKWPKEAGSKPTDGELKKAEELGGRQGAKATLALAMYLRDGGATNREVMLAVGGPQLNKMRALVTAGKATRVNMAPKDGHTVYKITLKAEKPKKASAPKKGGKKAEQPKGEAPAPAGGGEPEVQTPAAA